MTTRQSFTRSQNRSSMKPLHLGTASTHKAYVVKIDWTSAKIVKVSTNRDITLDVIEADVRKDGLRELRHFEYKVAAGEILYFAQSDDHAGYYYILRYTGTRFACTCPAGAHNVHCHHQADINDFILREIEAAHARETNESVQEALERIAAYFAKAA